jgi:hypothetical protein
MNQRSWLTLVASACVLAACSSKASQSIPTTSTKQSEATTTQSAAATTTRGTAITTTAPSPSTTVAAPPGPYSVTPIRSDGQRVTFRLTVPDGAVAEVSLSPADATITLIEPSVALVKPDGQSGGGGGIFSSSTADGMFASLCASVLGGNCTPKATAPLADGNRVEEFTRTDGGILTRVVFGPWATTVGDRAIAAAFDFHGGPDGFPVVAARTTGYSIKDSFLRIYMTDGRRYILRSDTAAACNGTSAPRCDRGVSVESQGSNDDVSVRRIS